MRRIMFSLGHEAYTMPYSIIEGFYQRFITSQGKQYDPLPDEELISWAQENISLSDVRQHVYREGNIDAFIIPKGYPVNAYKDLSEAFNKSLWIVYNSSNWR